MTTAANHAVCKSGRCGAPSLTVIETRTGRRLNLLDPAPSGICLDDIAWGLARQARFNGQTIGHLPYSVAQHSCWVADRVEALGGDVKTQLRALLHDGHEAYVGDITRPLKTLLNSGLSMVIDALNEAIDEAFELPPISDGAWALIMRADGEALAVEASALMPSRGADWELPDIEIGALLAIQAPWPQDAAACVWRCHYNRLAYLLRAEAAEEDAA